MDLRLMDENQAQGYLIPGRCPHPIAWDERAEVSRAATRAPETNRNTP